VQENRGGLQLGIFMPNCSNMYAISTYRSGPDEWPYESNKQIARAAEAAGFDFLFPVSRWRGFGGKTNYLGISLETMTWAAALLAVTQTIRVYSTVHVPVFHPLVAAKMGATLDHIGNGRWGINIVSGWSRVGWEESIAASLPPQNRTCPFRVIRLKQATYSTLLCSWAVNLLMAVQVYELQIVVSIFTPILPWLDVVDVQFFPIEEAFSAYLTDIVWFLATLCSLGGRFLT
jgi:hypothetical protein